MTDRSRAEAAERTGLHPAYLDRLLELGILAPSEPDRTSPGDVRRARLVATLEGAGIPIEGLAEGIRRGAINMDFLDAPSSERFAALGPETFRQVSDRTGVPLELVMTVREAIGLATPDPDDKLREDEELIVPFLQLQLEEGFSAAATERLLRVTGDSMRRITEQEGAWWLSEVVAPSNGIDAAGQFGRPELTRRVASLAEQNVVAMYHALQSQAWTASIHEGFERTLEAAGIHSRLERVPAICFLDITGYSRLTQERGDDAAAELASTLSRLVQRSSVKHGGKPIK